MTDLVLESIPDFIIIVIWGLAFLKVVTSSPEILVVTLVSAIFLWIFFGLKLIFDVIGEMEKEDPLF